MRVRAARVTPAASSTGIRLSSQPIFSHPLPFTVTSTGAPVLVTVNGKGWEKMGWDDSLIPVLDAAGVTLAARTRIRHMVAEGVHAELLELRRG